MGTDAAKECFSDAKPLVVRVEIPFCTHRCSFCAAPIHTGAPTAADPRKGDFALRGAYLDALLRELASVAPDLAGHRVQAAVIGGGIPTSYGGDDLKRLVRALKDALAWDEGAQITLQTVPGMLSADTFDTLRGLGVRRYEFGMGSFNHFEYELLDRPTARDAIHNMRILLGYAGIEDLGVRLFWGIPGQSAATLRSSIDEALENGATHVRLEPLPPMRAPRRQPPDEGERALLRVCAEKHLAEKGLPRYAGAADGAACFAVPGHEGRFDRLLDAGCDHMTLGLGGESLVDGLRTVNTVDLQRYIAGSPDPARIVETVEDLTLA